ncbi:hypothetical protein B0H13DRAFT_2682891, partial [Mycena leptocephala]
AAPSGSGPNSALHTPHLSPRIPHFSCTLPHAHASGPRHVRCGYPRFYALHALACPLDLTPLTPYALCLHFPLLARTVPVGPSGSCCLLALFCSCFRFAELACIPSHISRYGAFFVISA